MEVVGRTSLRLFAKRFGGGPPRPPHGRRPPSGPGEVPAPGQRATGSWLPGPSMNPTAATSSRLSSTTSSRSSSAAAAAAAEISSSRVNAELATMFTDIWDELDMETGSNSELSQLAKYYFDGQGKAIRPMITMTMAHAINRHLGMMDGGMDETLLAKQRKVALISEMTHTASLVHDDVLDKAETRRGKASVNCRYNAIKSVFAGNYILAVSSKILAQIRNEDVVTVLSQVLMDLTRGEFQQLQRKDDEGERFELYLTKTFNKTASLIAYSCKAVAILSTAHLMQGSKAGGLGAEAASAAMAEVDAAFQYGRNIGIAFQLVDDLLDFVSSSEQLGKPAAADLKLGLATAPILFALKSHPHLEALIVRGFSQPGDVETAFNAALNSDGLERTKELAIKHCEDAVAAIRHLAESEHKASLMHIPDTVVNRLK